MKKIFTLLLMLACALFVGVSCVQDQPDGSAEEVIDEVTPETFEIKFDEKTLTCANADFYCVPANKTKPYMMISSQEFEDDTVKPLIPSTAKTVEEKLRGILKNRVMSGVVVWPVDNNALYKGDSKTYSKIATRASNDDKVEVYVVGVNILDKEDLGGGDYCVLEADLSTEITTVEVPFLPYPVLTLGQPVGNLSSAGGSVTIDCKLENPVEGNEVRCESSVAWARPSYENGVLTIEYDENPYSIPRSATVSVEYGKDEIREISGETETIWVPLVYEKSVSITQEKNPDAPVYTFGLELVSNFFNKAIVNVKPSHNDVEYVVRVATSNNGDWATVAANSLRYPDALTYLKGDVENHSVMASSLSLGIDEGDKYYVYVFAVNSEHTAPISEVTSIEVTHTEAGTPVVGFQLISKEDTNGAYEVVHNDTGWVLNVYKAGVVEIPFDVENPVDGADFYFNVMGYHQETTLSDYDDQYNVIGNNRLVKIEDGKLIFTVKARPSDWNKGYNPYMYLSVKYALEGEFASAQSLKLVWPEK